jgi:hypothetical protein
LDTPRLEEAPAQIEVTGTVTKASNWGTTAHSHLDVSFFDEAGQLLLRTEIPFSPSSLSRRTSRTAGQKGSYSLPLDSLPTGTVRIEVRAFDSRHAADS